MDEKEIVNECKCGEEGSEVLHTCPFKLEIHYSEQECNCCDDCQRECRQSI